jgi:exopolyphosphatase
VIAEFLQEVVNRASIAKSPQLLRIVLGNQSADIDSIVSCIALCYGRRHLGLQVPVVNVTREEIFLRKDVCYLLEYLQIDPNSLFFKDDIPSLIENEENSLSITLVDHNKLAPDQEYLSDFVDEIIDHHSDEKGPYKLKNENKTIERRASTATLVTENLIKLLPNGLDPELACILLAALLLDSKNLRNTHVTTSHDIASADFLKCYTNSQKAKELYKELLFLRHDVEGLTSPELLRKDYKVYRTGHYLYGISSLPKGVIWWKDNVNVWFPSIKSKFEKEQLKLYFALVYRDINSEKRGFIIYCSNQLKRENLALYIQQNPHMEGKLHLSEQDNNLGLLYCDVYEGSTRKSLQPFIADFLKQ